MKSEIKNTTKTQIFDIRILDKVGPWLKSMGIKYNATRFGASTKVFKKWSADLKTPSFRELWGIAELMELCEFYNSFHSGEEDIKDLIHLIQRGSTTLEKSQSCSARDYSFELKVASRFKRAGFNIINDKSHDVIVEKDGKKLFLECKRPRKESTIVNNISYAYDEQFKDLANRQEQAILCIDLSNILYDRFVKSFKEKGEENITTNKEALEAFRDNYDRYNKNFLEENASEIVHGVRMVILSYSFPVFMEKPTGSGIITFQKFNHFTRITNFSDELDSTVSQALNLSTGVQFGDGAVN